MKTSISIVNNRNGFHHGYTRITVTNKSGERFNTLLPPETSNMTIRDCYQVLLAQASNL